MNLTNLADVCGTDKGTHQGFMQYYPKYLPPRGSSIELLELGVYQGASMKLWGEYFTNPKSLIFGVDQDLSQVNLREFGQRFRLIEGDQAELPEHYTYGQIFDVIIDDASHISSKTIASFHKWWPVVRRGGVYVVEDTHCSYDVKHYGVHESAGPAPLERTYEATVPTWKRPVTTMEFLKRLADDVNWNYHGYDRFEPFYRDIAFVHFYPGIVFIGKK